MNCDQFLEAAWNDHADDAAAVAHRLAESLDVIATPADVAPFARIVTHVYGEHLAWWQPGIELLAALRKLPAWDASQSHVDAVTRGQSVLRYCSGAVDALADLSAADRAAVLATAASALAGQKQYASAIAAYAEALAIAEGGLPAGSQALRALAAGGNNLASALEEQPDRTDQQTQGMLKAAAGGLKYWSVAGTWLETERAHYRMSCSSRLAGNVMDAVAHAQRCLEVCAANDASPFELFFGYAALAQAQRDAGRHQAFVDARNHALASHEAIGPDERRWCAVALGALGD